MAHTTGTTDRASEDHKAGENDERNPKTASKRQQQLESKAPKGKAADTDKATKEHANRKR